MGKLSVSKPALFALLRLCVLWFSCGLRTHTQGRREAGGIGLAFIITRGSTRTQESEPAPWPWLEDLCLCLAKPRRWWWWWGGVCYKTSLTSVGISRFPAARAAGNRELDSEQCGHSGFYEASCPLTALHEAAALCCWLVAGVGQQFRGEGGGLVGGTRRKPWVVRWPHGHPNCPCARTVCSLLVAWRGGAIRSPPQRATQTTCPRPPSSLHWPRNATARAWCSHDEQRQSRPRKRIPAKVSTTPTAAPSVAIHSERWTCPSSSATRA